MTDAVLNNGGQRFASRAQGSSGVSAGIAQLTGTPKLSPAAEPGEGFMRRAIRLAGSVGRRKTQTTFVGGLHQLRKGMVERAHFPKGGRIICCSGTVWITADGGGEDVVLSSGEFRWFRAGAWLLIEAIARSEVLVEA
jgi:quercetin dioxygenase-like cupin family protein